jgi:hypothetical protein
MPEHVIEEFVQAADTPGAANQVGRRRIVTQAHQFGISPAEDLR